MNRVEFGLICITPELTEVSLDVLVERVDGALDGAPGAAILWRQKKLARDHGARFFAGAERLRRVTEGRGLLLVHDRLDVALAVGADGVQLPGGGLPLAEVCRATSLLVGVSAHCLAELSALSAADYVLYGPVFAPRSKARDLVPRGLDELARAVAMTKQPIFALGGIDAQRALACRAVGARLACITEVLGSGTGTAQAAARLLTPPTAG